MRGLSGRLLGRWRESLPEWGRKRLADYVTVFVVPAVLDGTVSALGMAQTDSL